MTLTLTPDIEKELGEEARRRGTTLERLALERLRTTYHSGSQKPEKASTSSKPTALREPRDDWERLLRSAASDCGVSLTDEQASRDALYDDHL